MNPKEIYERLVKIRPIAKMIEKNQDSILMAKELIKGGESKLIESLCAYGVQSVVSAFRSSTRARAKQCPEARAAYEHDIKKLVDEVKGIVKKAEQRVESEIEQRYQKSILYIWITETGKRLGDCTGAELRKSAQGLKASAKGTLKTADTYDRLSVSVGDDELVKDKVTIEFAEEIRRIVYG